MEDNAGMFSSDIKVRSYPENFLNEILYVTPATPVKLNNTETYICDFKPKTGKCYIPKTKPKTGPKVKTVRDIRKSFEQNVFSHLITDLETQKSILLKNVQQGSPRDTKTLEVNILRGDTPITRSTWQMLMNLNPECQKYLRQYVLSNQKYIKVNGSYGGMKKQIMNYDLASKPQCISSQNYNKQCWKQHERLLKKRVLRNFSTSKPGPLCMKKKYAEKHAKTQNLTVVVLKLNCDNIEPWCMVHKLYKCFCKGKFTETYTSIRIESVCKEQGVLTSHAVNVEQSSNSDQNHETIIVSDSDNDDYLDFSDRKSMSSSRTSAYRRSCTEDCFITGPTRNTNNKTASGQHLPFNTDNNGSQFLPQSKYEMRAWIESLQMQVQDVLEPPRHGRRQAMFSWNFISRTFRERKHLFLITRKAPYKVYIAVNKTKNPYTCSCQNVNDIQLADLHKYPEPVQNLVYAKKFNDLFCILRGTWNLWELVSLVKRIQQTNESAKYAEKKNTSEMKLESSHIDTSSDFVISNSAVEDIEQKNMDTFDVFDQGNSEVNNVVSENVEASEKLTVFNNTLELRDSLVENMEQKDFHDKKGANQNKSEVNKSPPENMQQEDLQSITEKKFENNTVYSDEIGSPKWFVMTIENDFSVIRLEKNFFVNYRTMTEAIADARLFGKTKTIFKKCVGKPENLGFGIYAKPHHNENVVYFGPYEVEDNPRIQIIKTISSVRRLKSTRYAWIKTNKIDTFNVEENMLLFVPLPYSRTNSVFVTDDKLSKDQREKDDVQNSLHIKKTEVSIECSPPKKRKTGGFYHVASDDVKRKKSLQYPQNITKTIHTDNSVKSSLKHIAISNDLNRNLIRETSQDHAEPSSSAACQIKISAVFSIKNDDNPLSKHPYNKIFIFNPEESNSQLVNNKLTTITLISRNEYNNKNDATTNLDLLPSVDTESSTLNDDICVRSDDANYKTVWIECINIRNLGWIAGIRNVDHFLSFKIPKCEEYSAFYEENKALSKINVELRKRISCLNNCEIQWTVYESIDQVQGEEINAEKLFPNYILITERLLNKSEIIKTSMDRIISNQKTICLRMDGR